MRRKAGWIAILGLVLVLGACAAPAEAPTLHTMLSTDEFSKTADIVGPYGGANQFGGTSTLYRLVTRVDKKTHAYAHVLRAEVSFVDAPHRFSFAADDAAQELGFFPIARERADCAVCDGWEKFEITIPDAALRAHAATGYSIKVSSRDDDEVILTITPAMIATQFAGLEAFLESGTSAQQ